MSCCPNCGTKIVNNAKFCIECGEKLPECKLDVSLKTERGAKIGLETSMFGILGRKSMEQILQGLRDEED